jgi:hypothetical protein
MPIPIKYVQGHPVFVERTDDAGKDWSIRNPSAGRKPSRDPMAAFRTPPLQQSFIVPNVAHGDLRLDRNEPAPKLEDRSISAKWKYSKLRKATKDAI